ncbi:MAG: sugar phosphate nucleotidyltransferase [Elusimicrobiota bacterium]|jgi:mannose-1-phosphate guanylyltransferase
MSVYGLILAGGQSSRLFPFNKVLSDMTGSGRTLLQQALDRLSAGRQTNRQPPLVPPDHVYVLSAREWIRPMQKQLKLPARHFLSDPVRRGTWPALLWAMAHIRQQDPDALLAVVTGDHVIPDVNAFRQSLREAMDLAHKEAAIVLVGVQPTSNPEEWCGFGAVRTRGSEIIGFEEKPAWERAGVMIRQGGWLWNAGMFFYRISVAERALRQYQPAMAAIYDQLVAAIRNRREALAERLFSEFPAKIPHPLEPDRLVDNTIDYSIMTPLVQTPFDGTAKAATRALLKWTDLGQWDALRKVVPADSRNTIRIGSVKIDTRTTGSILSADKGYRIEGRGLQGLIAAFSNKTLLLLPERDVTRVKELVQAAQQAGSGPVFAQKCRDCRFQVKRGRLIAYGLKGISVRLTGRRVVLSGPGIIR